MNRIIVVTLLLFVTASIAEAQVASTYHVFPQVADGRIEDGTLFRSHFLVSNVNSPNAATCTIRLYGLSSDRLNPSTFTLGIGAIVRLGTPGQQTLASGYATLNCNQPVKAVVIYRYSSSVGGATLGMATVFPSPPSTNAYFLAPVGDRLAVAIANDTDNVQQYEVVARDGATIVATGSLSAPQHSNIARFADEFLTLPPGFSGAIYVNAAGGSTLPSAAFSTIGLIFNGAAFSTLPAFSAVP